MRDQLLDYYERELTFLRRTGADFAKRYPRVASRLMLEPTKCDDPHVERLLEGFAFLAARVHLRLDDDAPEIGEALLEAAYPQYVRPIPSLSIVQLHPDPDRAVAAGHRVPRDSLLYSRDVGGAPCKFRTCYDTTLWPVAVSGAKWLPPYELQPPVRAADAVAALRVELRCLPGATFATIGADSLRLHLNAEPNLAGTLYELLCNSTAQILVRDLEPGSKVEPVVLPASALTPVGFAEDEGMLPPAAPRLSGIPAAAGVLHLPGEVLVPGPGGVRPGAGGGYGVGGGGGLPRLPVRAAGAAARAGGRRHGRHVRLGCTPVANLFPQTSEPTSLDPARLGVPHGPRRAPAYDGDLLRGGGAGGVAGDAGAGADGDRCTRSARARTARARRSSGTRAAAPAAGGPTRGRR